MSLGEAEETLQVTCGELNVDIDFSWGAMLSGMVPDGEYTSRMHKLPVNWNHTFEHRKVIQTIFNYSGSEAPRKGVNEHLAIPRGDLMALLTVTNDTPKERLDRERQLMMRHLVPTHDTEAPIATLIHKNSKADWARQMMKTWRPLLLKKFYKDATKMECARLCGFEQEWKELLESMDNPENFKEDRSSQTGEVYTTRKNLEFLKLCKGRMPFVLHMIEGKHYSLVVSCMSLGLYVSDVSGTMEQTNRITYDYLVKNGIIKSGLEGRDFIDDLEDIFTGKKQTKFTQKASTFRVVFLKKPLASFYPMKILMKACETVSKSISDSKRDSNTPKARDSLANFALEVADMLTKRKLREAPGYLARNWIPVSASITTKQLNEKIAEVGEDDEFAIVGAPNFSMEQIYEKWRMDTQNSKLENKFLYLLSAPNVNASLPGQKERAYPPFINTMDTLVTHPSHHDSNPTHLLNTSKANMAYFFMKIMALLFAESRNIPLSQLKGNAELAEMIDIGIVYLCNNVYSKNDMSISKAITRWHEMLMTKCANFSIDCDNHSILNCAVLLATLFDVSLDLPSQHKRTNAKKTMRENVDTGNDQTELEEIKQKLKELRVALATMAQQISNWKVLNYNCGKTCPH